MAENYLKRARFDRDITQWRLATKVGMSQSKIWQIENNLRDATDKEKQVIAAALMLNVEEIFPKEDK